MTNNSFCELTNEELLEVGGGEVLMACALGLLAFQMTVMYMSLSSEKNRGL